MAENSLALLNTKGLEIYLGALSSMDFHRHWVLTTWQVPIP